MDGNTEKIKRKEKGNEIEKQYGKNYQVDEKGEWRFMQKLRSENHKRR